MPASLVGLTDQYIAFISEEHPVSATFLGLHSNDGTLGDMSRDAIAARRQRVGAMLADLATIPENLPRADQTIDREILRIALESTAFGHDVTKEHERNPSSYVGLALYGCNQLLLRDFASLEQRARDFASRLLEVPDVLAECRRNVEEPPAAFAKIGEGYARGGVAFIDGTIPHLSAELPDMSDELAAASDRARTALMETAEWLSRVASASEVPFHIGREAYEWLLSKVHLLDIDSDQLVEIGERSMVETRQAIEKAAAAVDRTKDWRDVVDGLRHRHPEAGELRDFYADEMTRARNFVRDHKLVTIPEKEVLSVVDTPVFLRSLLPYAAYGPPGPFERRQQGFFYVTPIDRSASPQEQELQLRGHSVDSIRVIALHEGYPGHHVQLVRANSVRGMTRKLARSNLFIEGWALYCEDMMRDEGFMRAPSMKLMQLVAALWRSARVVVDVRLQRGEMTLEEAASFMVSEAHLTSDKAVAEVTRYAMNPTQPSSYLLGKLAIVDIRRRYEEKAAESFDLRQFHDSLLDLGSIPPALVGTALGLEDGRASGDGGKEMRT